MRKKHGRAYLPAKFKGTRKFGDERFTAETADNKLRHARTLAASIRKEGRKARIVKMADEGGLAYVVYTHS